MLYDLLARVIVVLKAAPTYLVAASAAISAAAQPIADVLPDALQGRFASDVVRITGALAAAVLTVRRVTPVAEQLKGLLPPAE